MIGKVPRPGRGFRGLVSYLLHGSRRGRVTDRVAWTATCNLISDDPERAPALMRLTAARSVRVKRPVYHLVISWHRDERPTAELMRRVADQTCRDLGLDEHQRLYIAHRDREHLHVHVVVNRVHPETGNAWATSHDFRRIEQSLARQALELGLAVVPGRHNRRDLLDAERPRRPRDASFQQARRLCDDARPRHSKARIAELRGLLRPLFAHARSWQELHDALATHGFALTTKGQGLVLFDAVGELKLSDLGAGIRRATLEARFGRSWQPSQTREPRAASTYRSRRRQRER